MVKLESEKELLEGYLEYYKDNHNEIYFILENIAKRKYLHFFTFKTPILEPNNYYIDYENKKIKYASNYNNFYDVFWSDFIET